MNARFTSKADIDATQTDVCFVPIADIGARVGSAFLSEIYGLPHGLSHTLLQRVS